MLSLSLLSLFQGKVAYQNFTLSEPSVGYFNITVKMLTCKEVLIPVGLMFSYSHIEYAVAHLRQHTETFAYGKTP